MPSPVKVYKNSDPKAPQFPSKFSVVKRVVLQKTDLLENKNKYYNLELHDGSTSFRVFTHYGRTDDLERDVNSGAKESRFFSNIFEAQKEYERLLREKTGKSKGYKEVSLASTKIGSEGAKGTSSGHIDSKTIELMETKGSPSPKKKKSDIPAPLLEMVKYLYDEATGALTSTVSAKITAKGIETPLGVLTVGQIEKGEEILKRINEAFKTKKGANVLTQLSGEFYTAIPHKFGRTRAAAQAAVIDSLSAIQDKEEILQLMRDMLKVDGEKGGVLVSDDLDAKYAALNCEIVPIEHGSAEYKFIEDYAQTSLKKMSRINVKNVFRVIRPSEQQEFTSSLGNEKLLFHGSRIKNWVGILTRGILLPKLVTAMGVNRTDAGWLGNGIYFGDAACTSYYYASPGKRGTRIIALADVALGKVKQFSKITYGLDSAPDGYHSCHGVRGTQFADDEFVVYKKEQQKLKYIIEVA